MGAHKNITYTPIGDGRRAVNLKLLYKHIGEPDDNGCRQWHGTTNNIGYPFMGFKAIGNWTKSKMILATRVLLMVKLGREILPDHQANHTCHNRWCMNIDHIEEGTQHEKLQKMKQDNRRKHIRGGWIIGKEYPPKKQNRNYKYSEEQIQFCRLNPVRDIQQKYGWNQPEAERAKRGVKSLYKWLPWPEA